MIEFPNTRAALVHIAPGRNIRAGGTDLHERRPPGPAARPPAGLRAHPGLDTLVATDAGLQLGSRVRVATVAADATIAARWPALAAAAGGLATPQIRNVATLGRNLVQVVGRW